ncbi:MAG: TetR/AcrR family transcriptional regulator [Bacteroidales bacterium]|nr:TetR/AcrR family transcriptional regulator [Bacteroidales bacterium]
MKSNISTEEKLLLEAKKEFLEKGFERASMVNVAKRANVSHATFHYYFRTKEQLFERICTDKMNHFFNVFNNSFKNGETDIVSKIVSAVGTQFDALCETPQLPMFILNEIIANEKRAEMFRTKIIEFTQEHLEPMQEMVDTAIKRGEIAQIRLIDLMWDILALNLAAFMILPFAAPIAKRLLDENKKTFLQNRRQENIDLIRRRLTVA